MLDGGAPFYGVYETGDGKYVSIGSLEPQFYAELLKGLGLADPRFAKQWDKTMWPDLRRAISDAFRSKSRDEWTALLDGKEICYAPVLDMREAPAHPHNVARGTFVATPEGPMPKPAPRFSVTATDLAPPSQGPGAETGDILRAAGLSAADIDAAFTSGLVTGRT